MTLPVCIATKLLPLFENIEDYSNRLVSAGLDDFLISSKHVDSFAQSDGELQLSRRIRAETRKRSFWWGCLSSSPMSWHDINSTATPYQGNWLDQLMEERRNLLRDSGEAKIADDLRFPDLDPCGSRENQWSVANFENWCHTSITLRNQALERQMAYFKENDIHLPPVEDAPDSIRAWVADRFVFELDDPSFRRIKPRETRRVVFAKRIAKDLELRFVLEDSNWSFSQFRKAAIGPEQIWVSKPNRIEVALHLHGISQPSGRISDKPLVSIPYWHLLEPNVHGLYVNCQHLAYAILLPISLYRMVAAQIEEACLSCHLESLSP